MKERVTQREKESRTLGSKPRASNQASISEILQAYKTPSFPIIQRESLPEEDELLQGKFDTAQREAIDEEEEPLQGKFDTAQREALPDEDEEPIQQKAENKTGLPDNLKAGVEAMSGFSMDDVRVHYNSPKPAQLQALAYAQGSEIHVGPGQEQHLPHEAWHVVQQKQGRVQPTMRMQGAQVNDDEGLEREADVMGDKINFVDKRSESSLQDSIPDVRNSRIAQMKFYFKGVNDIPGTALKRVWEHPLAKEIEESDKPAEVKFVSSNYSANSGYLMNGTKPLGLGAKLELPQKEDEQAEDLEALKKKNEVTTLHELVHARAIFNDEFDVSPMVFHTVYKNTKFEGRELIPLEEALTVGFKNSAEFAHTLHRADTLENVSILSSEQWGKFAPKQENRYKRIYGDQEIAGNSVFTDNLARKEKEVSSREFYAEEARGNDEAWNGTVKETQFVQRNKIKDIDSYFEQRKSKYEVLRAIDYTTVKKLFEKHNAEAAADEFDLFAPAKMDVPAENVWQQARDAFAQQWEKMKEIRTLISEKGKLDSWFDYQKEYENLKKLKFVQYMELQDESVK